MKTSAYVIEIEQSEKETGKTMHNKCGFEQNTKQYYQNEYGDFRELF